MNSTQNLTTAQQAAMTKLQERGYLSTGAVSFQTIKALAAKGLVDLKIETHNAWFGGYRTTIHPPVREWNATAK